MWTFVVSGPAKAGTSASRRDHCTATSAITTIFTAWLEFATPQRPAFTAEGGYAGSQILGAASKRFRSFWVGGFVRLDTLAGATFEASPLVRKNESFAAGFAIAWIFESSQRTVEAEE
jgi:hypothetical protein